MYYYHVSLLGSSAPGLTYHSSDQIEIGSVVSVPLQTKLKEAVAVKKVGKPAFDTAQIEKLSDRFYTPEQIDIAKFISEYYFSSFGRRYLYFYLSGKKK